MRKSENQACRAPRSIFLEWIVSFSALGLLFFVLFLIFARMIIFARSDKNINTLLERAMTITWEEYNAFFQESTSMLEVLADELEANVISVDDVSALLEKHSDPFDLWFITDQEGIVLLASGDPTSSVSRNLSALLEDTWQSGRITTTSEVVELDPLREFDANLAQEAVLNKSDPNYHPSYDALFQVTAVPYRDHTRQVAGAIVVAHLLNNDNSVALNTAAKIPQSYSSLSCGGIRIAGNLFSSTNPSYVGERQIPEHIETIQAGRRYYGRNVLAMDLDHLVVSDPIFDLHGRVIGALTIGHPSQGLASLKQDTLLYIFLSVLLCWGVVFAGSTVASRRLALPITDLSKLANQIDEAETVKLEHVSALNSLRAASSREIQDLQRCFARMASSLYEKGQEVQLYLGQLEKEQSELEARVEEKTMELRNAVNDLTTSNELKSRFLAKTSHELRTPLHSIVGFSQMLHEGIYGSLTERQQETVGIVLESSRYLQQLINDLLDESMIEQGKIGIQKELVSLESLIDSVMSIIQVQCKKKDISVTVAQLSSVPPLFVDPTRIRQVLYNVLSNAVKFTPSGGSVEIQVDTSDEQVIILVKDTGVGISKEDQMYVFDEFYQGERTSKPGHEGFGLGLPLSRKLVQLHEGTLELKSVPGKGTTVIISLPLGHIEGTTPHRP